MSERDCICATCGASGKTTLPETVAVYCMPCLDAKPLKAWATAGSLPDLRCQGDRRRRRPVSRRLPGLFGNRVAYGGDCMTIHEMPAGPETDRRVAEEVMGWLVIPMLSVPISGDIPRYPCLLTGNGTDFPDRLRMAPGNYIGQYRTFSPSTSIADAWVVVERMRGNGWLFSFGDDVQLPEWVARFDLPSDPPRSASAYAETPYLAICRAGLLASLSAPPESSPAPCADLSENQNQGEHP